MEGYPTLEPGDAARAFITWAESEWPLSEANAQALVTRLGWIPLPASPGAFSFPMNPGAFNGYFLTLDGNVSSFSLVLADVPDEVGEERAGTMTSEYLAELVAALEARWGRGEHSSGVASFGAHGSYEWTLPSGATVSVDYSARRVVADLESPQFLETLCSAAEQERIDAESGRD